MPEAVAVLDNLLPLFLVAVVSGVLRTGEVPRWRRGTIYDGWGVSSCSMGSHMAARMVVKVEFPPRAGWLCCWVAVLLGGCVAVVA